MDGAGRRTPSVSQRADARARGAPPRAEAVRGDALLGHARGNRPGASRTRDHVCPSSGGTSRRSSSRTRSSPSKARRGSPSATRARSWRCSGSNPTGSGGWRRRSRIHVHEARPDRRVPTVRQPGGARWRHDVLRRRQQEDRSGARRRRVPSGRGSSTCDTRAGKPRRSRYDRSVVFRAGRHRVGGDVGTLQVRTYREGIAQKVGHDLIIDVGQWEAAAEVGEDGTLSAVQLDADPAHCRCARGCMGSSR